MLIKIDENNLIHKILKKYKNLENLKSNFKSNFI